MPAKHPVVIVGCGFGGVALGIGLKRAGIDDFVILERAADLGGVWRDNTYPGCACDVPSIYYSFSFEQDYPWSAWHAPWNEIHAYLRHCAGKYGLLPHIRFGVTTKGARFDAADATWRVETADGETIVASALVSATGIFGAPQLPAIPGIETFAGPWFHSSNWRHDVHLRGKRVAAIGVGASAIQYVPRVAEVAERLFVAQRTPQYVRARDEGPAPDDRRWYHGTTLWRRRERQKMWASFEENFDNRNTPDKRLAQEQEFRQYLEQQVPDPVLRAKLTPDYPLGCKRVLASNDFYPAMQRPNVELVTDSVAEITRDGFRTRDGRLREVDVIVYSTGFRPTEYLSSLRIEGLDGKALPEAWNGEPEAYLGATVCGFPNFFMLYGPNTNGSGSIVYMLEAEAQFVTSCLLETRRRGADTIQPTARAQRDFNEMLQRKLALMPVATPGCNSYFKTKTGKIATQWPARMSDYDQRARNPDWSDFEFGTTRQEAPADAPERAFESAK